METVIIYICAAAALLLALLLALLIYRGNKRIDVTEYEVCDPELPAGFEGARIAHISDLHSNLFGKNNERLISLIAGSKPDYIFITGDLLDSRLPRYNVAEAFVMNIADIAPVYFCTGNHESRQLSDLKKLEKRFRSRGVKSLRNSFVNVRRNGSRIRINGIDDSSFILGCQGPEEKREAFGQRVRELISPGHYNILLAHKPHLMKYYKAAGADLVFSGHAHGGQFRLPFGIPLFVPDEGFFPKYAQGVIIEDNTRMVVSRGLGQSVIPFRINNSPELVVVTLHRGEQSE